MTVLKAMGLGFLVTATALSAPAAAYAQRTVVGPRTNAQNPNDPPFSSAVRIGDTLYLSGQLGLGPDRKPPLDVKEEAKLVMDAMKKVLHDAGMTPDDLVSVQIFCSDVSQYDAFNMVYRTYFTREFPARAFLGSGPLLFGARFEVQGIAVKR